MMFWRKPAAQTAAQTQQPAPKQTSKYGKRQRAFDEAMRADLPDYITLGTCALCNWQGSDLALRDSQCVNVLACEERRGAPPRVTSVELLRQRGRELHAWEIHTGLRTAQGRWLGPNNATHTQRL